MREYQLPLGKTWAKGLGQDFASRNSGRLSELTNLRANPYAVLTQVKQGAMPFDQSLVAFPFPHLLQGSQTLFLCHEDTIQKVDDSDNTLVDLEVYNPASPDYLMPITAGGIWHLADFQNTYALFNGTCVVYRTHKDGITLNGADKTYVQTDIVMQSGINYNGQLVCAGPPAQFWPEAWQTAVNTMASTIDTGLTLDWSVENSFVFWGLIGGGDMLWLIDPTYAASGDIAGSGYGTDKPLWYDLIQRGDSGFCPLPTRGTVLVVKQLDKHIIVYTTQGIFALVPGTLSGRYGDDAIPTFGVKTITRYANVAGRGAVCGDLDKHYFLTADGEFWLLDGKLQPSYSRQREYLQPLASHCKLSYDDIDDEVYISGDSSCFIRTPAGLSMSTQPVCDVQNILGDTLIIRKTTTTADTTFHITTEVHDFGLRGQKSIQGVDVQAYNITDLQVSILGSYDNGLTWQQTPWCPASPEGFTTPQMTAPDIKISLKGTVLADGRIDGITVHWKLSDKRGTRGLFANTADSSTG